MYIKTKIEICGGCGCGDTIQNINVKVPDHGQEYNIVIGWCMDCKKIVGYATPTLTKDGFDFNNYELHDLHEFYYIQERNK